MAMPTDLKLDPRPLYAQVRELLTRRISSGALRPGALLPSEFQIAAELGVSQGTVRKALDALAIEGLVVRRQGKGTFVVEQTPQDVHFRFFNIYTADGRKVIPDSRETRIKTAKATVAERRRLAIDTGARVVRLRRIRTHGDQPFISETIVIPEARFPGLAERKTIPNTLYDFYQAEFGVLVVRAEDQLEPVVADKNVSSQLAIAEGAPLMRIERVAFGLDNCPVEWRSSLCNLAGLQYVAHLGQGMAPA